MKLTIAGLIALVLIGVAADAAQEDETFDLLMSDMPLKVVKNADLEGEHQANDLGIVIMLVPYCEGTAI